MPRYSDERRQAVVAKLLPPYNQSVEDVARLGKQKTHTPTKITSACPSNRSFTDRHSGINLSSSA